MSQLITPSAIFDAIEQRRAERRRFLKLAGGTTFAAGGLALLAACGDDDDDTPTPTPSPTPSPTPTSTPGTATDADILNFALNLEYVEATFYSYAINGTGLAANLTASGSGTAGGTVTGGARVDFSGDPVVGAYARELAVNEATHVAFLKTALGTAAVAMPNLNISGDANGAFTAAARAAGVVGASETFNPYASPENFLLGAFIFEDVGVTAYKGAAPLLSSATFLEAAAGILAAEGYHAGLIRTALYAKGIEVLRTNANKISEARDGLDGTTGNAADRDQGITGSQGESNLVPTDGNGIAFSRTTSQVLNIAYLNTNARTVGASSGGFFPNGFNANLAAFKTSTANP